MKKVAKLLVLEQILIKAGHLVFRVAIFIVIWRLEAPALCAEQLKVNMTDRQRDTHAPIKFKLMMGNPRPVTVIL